MNYLICDRLKRICKLQSNIELNKLDYKGKVNLCKILIKFHCLFMRYIQKRFINRKC